ncbi:hypothetical protein MMC27_008843 [Xylographa pallens]|nr:hypothetical protein [Xylographa pallens]
MLAVLGSDLNYLSLIYAFISLLLLSWVASIVYNICFHPLANVPGPLWWRACRFGFIRSLVSGNLVIDVKRLHERYGDVVRTAPDEVSFAREDAWIDIFSAQAGHKPFPRDPTFFKSPPGQPDNLVTTIDGNKSARMRQLVMPAFTERALMKQEPTIQSYAALMMDRLMDQATAPDNAKTGVTVNIVEWFNWFTFDVIGELTLGESFECLQNTRNHPWVSMIFDALKVMALAAATRYYPGLESLLIWLVPASIRKIQHEHYATALDKIYRRMGLTTERDDFMTPMIENNPKFERMSIPEIESTTALLLIAGSETTGTTLCGITNYLVQNRAELQKLETEIRGRFAKESDMTLHALQKLPFLTAVICEGLRLCNPVAGGILRIAPEGGASVCGYFLPGGTHVAVNTTALSRSDANFHCANDFLPDRFLPEDLRPAAFERDRRSNQKPFGLGARSCLGKSVAWAEMRVVLARLVWRFDIGVAEGRGVDWMDLKTYIVVQKEPIGVRVKVREMGGLA